VIREEEADADAAHVDRPDGVHFTVAAGLAIADQWLASALLAIKRG
jgi:hypothetical protein